MTTIAGGNGRGARDGPCEEAQFAWPVAVAVHADGSIYVADSDGNRIRRIDADTECSVTTVAGPGPVSSREEGRGGFRDGPAAEAEFRQPHALAFDSEGNLFIADTGNNLIRRLSPGGRVSTVAGPAGGKGEYALFSSPRGIAIDDEGNIFFTESNNAIRRIDRNGFVSTVFSTPDYDEGGALSSFLVGIAVGPHGELYIADGSFGRVLRYTRDGVLSVVADAQHGVGSRLLSPSGDCRDASRRPLHNGQQHELDPEDHIRGRGGRVNGRGECAGLRCRRNLWRRCAGSLGMAMLAALLALAAAGGAGAAEYGAGVVRVEVRVLQNVEDGREIHIGARPAAGSWRTLGRIPLALDDGVSATRYRYGDIALDVPLANWASPVTVHVRVWQDVRDDQNIYISARGSLGEWDTLGTISLPLDDGLTPDRALRYGDVRLEVPLPREAVSTLAGQAGEWGYEDARGRAVRFGFVGAFGLAVDQDGERRRGRPLESRDTTHCPGRQRHHHRRRERSGIQGRSRGRGPV